MKKFLNVLKKCSLFSGIKDDDISTMLLCLGARVMDFDKKYTVIAEGTPAKFIGIVLSGSVQIVRSDYFGNRSLLSELYESETFGEAFACAEIGSTPVEIIANEPCEIMLIECSHILHTCENCCGFHEQLIYNLMKNLAHKTLSLHEKIEITSKRSTREKLLTYLTLYSKSHDSKSFDIPFDRQELADYLEVDRSGLSSEIGKMKREGLIANEKNHFELL